MQWRGGGWWHHGGGRRKFHGVGAVGVFELRRAEMVGADQGADAREGFGEAVRIAEAGFKEALLANERARGDEAKVQSANRRGSLDGFEMRVERAKKNFRVGGRLGETEGTHVGSVVLETERECDLDR